MTLCNYELARDSDWRSAVCPTALSTTLGYATEADCVSGMNRVTGAGGVGTAGQGSPPRTEAEFPGVWRLFAVGFLAALSLVSWSWPSEAAPISPCPAHDAKRVSSSAVVMCLAAGEPIELAGATIEGDLVISDLTTVQRPFSCIDCRFTGSIEATEVSFVETINIAGSDIQGPVVMQGTEFEGPAILSDRDHPTGFKRGLDLSLASFGDIVTFERATIRGFGQFSSTRFAQAASFLVTAFLSDADFSGAVFSGQALFGAQEVRGVGPPEGHGACSIRGYWGFEGTAWFSGTSFQRGADFRQRCFGGVTDFSGADFREPADFSQVEFLDRVVFKGARLQGGAAFRGAGFHRNANLEEVTSGKDVDFTAATFHRRAIFFGVASEGLTFENATFFRGVRMEEISVQSLLLEVDDAVEFVRGDLTSVLQSVEDSAETRGDLGIANEAHFELRKHISQEYPLWLRFLDFVAYRGLAGYLVRPLHPVIALILLALLMSAIRFRSSTQQHRREGTRSQDSSFRATVRETLRRVWFRQTPNSEVPAPYGWEVWIYRGLIVLILVGLGNSNPTLKQMFDALA